MTQCLSLSPFTFCWCIVAWSAHHQTQSVAYRSFALIIMSSSIQKTVLSTAPSPLCRAQIQISCESRYCQGLCACGMRSGGNKIVTEVDRSDTAELSTVSHLTKPNMSYLISSFVSNYQNFHVSSLLSYIGDHNIDWSNSHDILQVGL